MEQQGSKRRSMSSSLYYICSPQGNTSVPRKRRHLFVVGCGLVGDNMSKGSRIAPCRTDRGRSWCWWRTSAIRRSRICCVRWRSRASWQPRTPSRSPATRTASSPSTMCPPQPWRGGDVAVEEAAPALCRRASAATRRRGRATSGARGRWSCALLREEVRHGRSESERREVGSLWHGNIWTMRER